MKLILAVSMLALSAAAAVAQPAAPIQVVLRPDATLLNVTAEGRSQRRPDIATFNAGVVTQAKTAGEALNANAQRMEAVIAALKRGGVAERDIQTATLQIQPQYYYPQTERPTRLPTGEVAPAVEPQAPRIVGYEARNTVTVRLRRLDGMGRVIDALTGAGANQVDGPYFSMENPEATIDEARAEAMKSARRRAELYARAAGLRVGRMLTITEGGGYYPVTREIVVTAQSAAAPAPPPPPSPVQPGELTLATSLSVQFSLEP